MKKTLCLLVAFILMAISVMPAFAAGINGNEQSVLAQMRTPANMKGNMVYVPASYVNQAEAHFNTIDMTSSQASEINGIISQGRTFLEKTGKASIKDLTGSEKKTMLQYASAAAAVLNLSAAAGSDAAKVKVIDKNGNVIVDDSGNVIKTTGAQSTVDSTTVFAFILTLSVIAAALCGTITVSKKVQA